MKKRSTKLQGLMPKSLLHPSERPPVPAFTIQPSRYRSWFVVSQLLRILKDYLFHQARLRRGGMISPKRGDRVILILQQLGMLWIRVAQVMFSRSTHLSSPFGLKLLNIRDRGKACPFPVTRQIVEKNLNRPLEDVFDHFEERPFYATTVSQVFKARLKREKIWVAAKVQQPFAEKVFDRDLKLLRRLIRVMNFFHIRKDMRWDDLFHELKEVENRELNYYFEASAMKTLKENLVGQPIHVSEVFKDYCGPQLLVTEFIQGALLSDITTMREKDPHRLKVWLQENNIDLETVASHLFYSVYQQVFENNFFHGDLHTDNIILLRNNHLAIIECRSAGSLEVESLAKQKMFLKSLTAGEYVKAAEIYFLLATRLPRVDLLVVKEQLVRLFRVWESRVHVRDLPYEEKSLALMMGEVNQVVYSSRFTPLWSYSKLSCTLTHLDIALGVLHSGLNYVKHLKSYFRSAENRETTDNIRHLPERLATALVALHEIPERISDYSLFQESMYRRKALVVQGSVSKIDSLLSALFSLGSFVSFVLLLFALGAFVHHQGWLDLNWILGEQLVNLTEKIPPLGATLWVAILILLTGSYLFYQVQKKRFKKCDYEAEGQLGAEG